MQLLHRSSTQFTEIEIPPTPRKICVHPFWVPFKSVKKTLQKIHRHESLSSRAAALLLRSRDSI